MTERFTFEGQVYRLPDAGRGVLDYMKKLGPRKLKNRLLR